MSLISKDQLEDRMSAISDETVVEKTEMTERGKMLYERFCMLRAMNAKANYEEDVKIRDLFIKLGKEQAEKAEAELYNKESEGEMLNTIIEEKSGLQEAFEEMVEVKNAYEELQKEAEKIKAEINEFKNELIG
jgi:hypothetical protein